MVVDITAYKMVPENTIGRIMSGKTKEARAAASIANLSNYCSSPWSNFPHRVLSGKDGVIFLVMNVFSACPWAPRAHSCGLAWHARPCRELVWHARARSTLSGAIAFDATKQKVFPMPT
jgi:hypothetical protein